MWWIWKRHQEGEVLFPPTVDVEEFVDDDGYLRWLRSHPRGLVLNCERIPGPNYLVLHRATCSTISGIPARGHAWTKDYIKVCGIRRHDLDRWAEDRTAIKPGPCGICLGY